MSGMNVPMFRAGALYSSSTRDSRSGMQEVAGMIGMNSEAETKDAFTRLIAPHHETLFGGALHFAGNRSDAEDLLQETYMRSYVGYKRHQDIRNPRAWLFKIMRNAYINRYHKKIRRPASVSYDESLDGRIEDSVVHVAADPREEFFDRFLDEEVENALDSLPEQFRETVILCDISGLSYEEIGQIIGCPLGTVRSRICRGRELLARKLYRYASERNLIAAEVRV